MKKKTNRKPKQKIKTKQNWARKPLGKMMWKNLKL